MREKLELLAQRISERKSTLVEIDNCLFLISNSEELDRLINIPKYIINNIEISTLYEIPPVVYWGTIDSNTLSYLYSYSLTTHKNSFGVFVRGLYNLYQVEYIQDVFQWTLNKDSCEAAIYYMGKPHVLN